MVDPFLKQLWKNGHEMDATLRIWVVVGGRIVCGVLNGGRAFTEEANKWLDGVAESLVNDMGLSEAQVDGLSFERVDDPDEPDYVTLTETIVFQPFGNFDLKAMRIDLNQVEAWWLGEPEYEDDAGDGPESGDDED